MANCCLVLVQHSRRYWGETDFSVPVFSSRESRPTVSGMGGEWIPNRSLSCFPPEQDKKNSSQVLLLRKKASLAKGNVTLSLGWHTRSLRRPSTFRR